MNKYEKALDEINKTMNEWGIYHCATSRQLLQELVELATPKKVKDERPHDFIIEYRCPECESELEYIHQQYCDACGQKLDWSE